MSAQIVILSRRPLIRELLAAWLRGKIDAEVVVATHPSEPHLVPCSEAALLVLDASDCTAFSAIEVVRAIAPSIRVLIVSGGQGDYVLHRASLAGATGVVHESDTLEMMAAAVTAVLGGGLYHSAGAVQQRGTVPVMKALTTRELLVLEHACAGTADDVTARLLGCASATVETHRRNLMKKIGATDWAELMVRGIQLGVVAANRIELGSRRRRSSVRRKIP